jgi:hypothetical protein
VAQKEYWIYKMYRVPLPWDGPYASKKAVLEVFRRKYLIIGVRKQDFKIYKHVVTPLGSSSFVTTWRVCSARV